MRRLRLVSLMAVLAGLVLGISALSMGGSAAEAAPEDDIEALLANVMEAWNEGDIDTFITYWTPEGLADQFDYGDEDPTEFIAGDREETGRIASITVTDIKAQSGNATGIVDLQFEVGFSLYEEWKFYNLPGGWKIGPGEPVFRPIPPGVAAVDMTLQEYAFVYNKDAINAADGNFAFQVTNAGKEEHEIVFVSLEPGTSILELIEGIDLETGEFPSGGEFIAFGGFYAPGTQGTAVLPEPLSPGNYGLVCFLPAPDGTPHAFLGMVSEFSVGGAAITPPSTGDGGLLGQGTGGASWLMLGIALTLVLGGTAGLVRSRVVTGA